VVGDRNTHDECGKDVRVNEVLKLNRSEPEKGDEFPGTPAIGLLQKVAIVKTSI
jgi:hypothetical protein